MTYEVFKFLSLENKINLFDIGAAAIAEEPIYKSIMDIGAGSLYAFDGDVRQKDLIYKTFGKEIPLYKDLLFDGSDQTLYISSAASGMTSLLKPNNNALKFFNNFSNFGKVERTEKVSTKKLDDLKELPLIDFLKMDVQGSELTILKNGSKKLRDCLAIQLEISFISLYENQPTFGDIDRWMRSNGFAPHRFIDVKRWSISPTIFNNNFRVPGNQLLEGDIIYIKDPLKLSNTSNKQLKILATLSHYCFQSIDLCVFYLIELINRKIIEKSSVSEYFKLINSKTKEISN